MSVDVDEIEREYRWEPDDVAGAVGAYEVTLNAVATAPAEMPADEFAAAVRQALLARDRVDCLVRANYKRNQPPSPEELRRLAALDRTLKNRAKRIVAVVGRETLADWRASVCPPDTAWWWSLHDLVPQHRSLGDTNLTVFSWILIAVAVSSILEILRRFISGGTDLPSTVVQGLLGLVAGGTVVQWARQFVEGGQRGGGLKILASHRARLTAVVVLVLIASVMEWARPRVAHLYNDWGVRLYENGNLTAAIEKYQRAINLEPTYAVARFNIANAYEDVLDFEKAMAGYRSAILADGELYAAYNNLARLYIVQRKDHIGALKLLDTALELQIEGEPEIREYIRYVMHKNHGWANLGLKNYVKAKEDLRQALRLRSDGAEAHCLLAQVLEEEKDAAGAASNWRACGELAVAQSNEIEPQWAGLVLEKLK